VNDFLNKDWLICSKKKKEKKERVVGRKDIKVISFTRGIDEFIRGGREIDENVVAVSGYWLKSLTATA